MILKNQYTAGLISRHLLNKQVVIIPTDTVYGLCCLASNQKGIQQIYQLKNREKRKPLQLLVNNCSLYLQKLALTESLHRSLDQIPSGAATYIFENSHSMSHHLSPYFQELQTLGIRSPQTALFRQLFQEVQTPIIATSVNLSGEEPYTEEEIIRHFGQKVPLIILEDHAGGGTPSAAIEIIPPDGIIWRRQSNTIPQKVLSDLKRFQIEF